MQNLTVNSLVGGFDGLKIVFFVLFGLLFLNYTGQNRRGIRVVAGQQKCRNHLRPWSIRVTWNKGRFHLKGVKIMRTIMQKMRALRLARTLLPAAVIAFLLAFAPHALAGPNSSSTPGTTEKQTGSTIYFTDLTDENIEKVLDPNGKEPYLLETCVTEACTLEQDDLNVVAKAFDGKIRVVRINTTLHPKLYMAFLAIAAVTSGQPTLPAVIEQTAGRWVMHTVLAPNTMPFASSFGLATADTIANFTVGILAKVTSAKPNGDAPKPDHSREI